MVCVAAMRAPAALPERLSDEPVSYKFDRRNGRRQPASYLTPATYSDGEGRFGVTSVQVVDTGPGGLGLHAACSIEPGMKVTLHASGSRFPSVVATAVRCIQSEEGYRVGLAIPLPNRAA